MTSPVGEITIRPIDAIFCQVTATPDLFRILYDYYAILVEGYQFMPAYKYGRWDGKIRFLRTNGQTYHGIADDIKRFAEEEGIKITDHRDPNRQPCEPSAFVEHLKKLNIDKYTPRKHQTRGALACLQRKRGILLHATGSGKCVCGSTRIEVKSKKTGEVREVTVREFWREQERQ